MRFSQTLAFSSSGKFKIVYDENAENKYGDFGEMVVKTYGESTSLKLKPRPEDADIIKHAFTFEE